MERERCVAVDHIGGNPVIVFQFFFPQNAARFQKGIFLINLYQKFIYLGSRILIIPLFDKGKGKKITGYVP